MSLGLLIRDAEDDVEEGDGDRLIRIWKFLTFLYSLNGANKCALAGLRVQASTSGLLTPRDAHRFKGNRFTGLQEGPGTRISRDLRLEQHNKIAKEKIREKGVQNINDKRVEEITLLLFKSEGLMGKIIILLERILTLLLKRETVIIPTRIRAGFLKHFTASSSQK